MDNLYSSVPLAQKLQEMGTSLLGTMRLNRLGIPKRVKSLDKREPYSTEILWESEEQKLSMLSDTPPTKSKAMTNVNVCSTMPPLLGITKDDGKFKPALIKLYDFTKGKTLHIFYNLQKSINIHIFDRWN